MNNSENTRIIMRTGNTPATLRMVGDVGYVLRALCAWKSATSAGSKAGNIAAISLPDRQMRFGLGAAAFGPSPEQAIQRLGECALIDGVSWWTPAEKSSTSRSEVGASEMLTPFLIAWDALDSAWAFLDSSSSLPLVKWYEHILEHPGIRKTGAIAVEVVAQIPAGMIADKYMYRAPLAASNTLSKGQVITDPDLIDVYFSRNTIRRAVPPDTLCTLLMVGVVIDPLVVTTTWGDGVRQRGFYATPGISSHANVIHHTHAAVVLDSRRFDGHLQDSSQSIEDKIALVAQELVAGTHEISVVHVESDTRLTQAVARIGIIENIEIKPWPEGLSPELFGKGV